ncbi:restriction endonuclease subunit S [Kaistia dalseonensis]|uniref:Type I restriction enzyme S subunit n=1 Tax=Kaistia dalseonensis TaxID=410840 RepID=A0ABU0H2G0_9HYPH|nr:restriction endonuclease subunit S [Kaistia dalseonensis]MCX5493919.1 restriction endonuclease subunit S [Kaistia dalseonensis]MDQ0436488.1 type I restriction enzyme S subunit [Kaistia dalseonensis]
MSGIIPKGWKTLELDEIAFVQTGIAINGEPDRTNPIRLPYLRVANVQDGHIDLSEVKYITVSEHQVARYALQVGDVLMTEGGDFDKLGRGAVWNGQIAPCLHQNHVFAVRPDQAQVLSAFLAAYCESAAGKRYFLSCSKQTTNLASINSTQLKEMPIVVPPLREQQRIVMALNAWDHAIDQTERLITAKRIEFNALYESLIGVGRRNAKLETKWIQKKLGDVIFLSSGQHVASALVNDAGLGTPYLTGPSDFAIAHPLATAWVEVPPVVCSEGDILVTVKGSGVGTMSIADQSYCISRQLMAITPKSVDAGFLFFVSEREISNRARNAHGLIPQLTRQDICDITIELPDLADQVQISRVLYCVREQVNALTLLVDRLTKQKRGLMQKLLTGEWRLDERFDAEALSPHASNVGGHS